MVLLLLNFLIAIVGQSYDYLLDHRTENKFEGRHLLNVKYMNETFFFKDKTKTIYSIAFATKTKSTKIGENDIEKGVTNRIKQQLKKMKSHFNSEVH